MGPSDEIILCGKDIGQDVTSSILVQFEISEVESSKLFSVSSVFSVSLWFVLLSIFKPQRHRDTD